MSLRDEMVKDLKVIETDLGGPYFIWKNTTYNFIPSVSEFRRELDTGGYKVVKLLSATIRKYNTNGTPVFSGSVYPSAQDIIQYTDGNEYIRYRIETVKHSPEGAYIRIVANSDVKGI